MRFRQLTLHTDNVDAQYDFYRSNLQLPVTQPQPDVTVVQVGATQLIFKQGILCRYHFAINIPENQFAEGKAWLLNRVSLIPFGDRDEIPFPAWEAHAMYFFDAAGNVVEFIARHRLLNANYTPFKSEHLLSVSEIGLAARDVLALATALKRDVGLPIFDGEGSDSFTAIGDDEGLFIVVPVGRMWFPETGVAAELYPADVVLDTEGALNFTPPGLPYRIVGAIAQSR
jgi:catechol-2,3-dioxygenase